MKLIVLYFIKTKSNILYYFVYQNTTTLPEKLLYSLRFPSELRSVAFRYALLNNWHTDKVYPPYQSYATRDLFGSLPNYNSEGFLSIQNAIAAAYIKLKTKQEMPGIFMKVD